MLDRERIFHTIFEGLISIKRYVKKHLNIVKTHRFYLEPFSSFFEDPDLCFASAALMQSALV